jgi:hypothetical protein
VDAEGDSVTLKNYDHWCSNGWDAESPMCSGEIQGRYWYIDTQAVRCPRNGKVVFSVGTMIIILLLFFAINEVRPKYPVFDVVLMSYQDLGIITLSLRGVRQPCASMPTRVRLVPTRVRHRDCASTQVLLRLEREAVEFLLRL